MIGMSAGNRSLVRANIRIAAWIIAVVAMMSAPVAAAQDDEKFSVSLGVFITDRNSDTNIGVSGDPRGTPVDLEADLGLDTSDTVFRLDGYYRFNDKHRIDISAFDLSRTSTKTIAKEIDWNGTIYPINTTVKGEFDLNIYKVAYTWAFMRRDKGYLGVTGGLYIADIGTLLSAANIADRDGGTVTAPLPVVGLRGEYQISDKWSFRASGEIFSLNYQDYDGSLTDFYAGVDYKLFKHASIGLGVNSVKIDLDVQSTDLNGAIDWRYDGGLVFFKFDF
jgi:hypothetical protein